MTHPKINLSGVSLFFVSKRMLIHAENADFFLFVSVNRRLSAFQIKFGGNHVPVSFHELCDLIQMMVIAKAQTSLRPSCPSAYADQHHRL